MGKRRQRREGVTYQVRDTKTGIKMENLNNFYEVSDAINRTLFSGFNIISYQTARNLWRRRELCRDCYDRIQINIMANGKVVKPGDIICGKMVKI
jgi:hypothetical protein